MSAWELERGALTSSAAIVTVWFVTITGRMLAWHTFRTFRLTLERDERTSRTWLFVMEEKRNIAEGSERKKIWAAERK